MNIQNQSIVYMYRLLLLGILVFGFVNHTAHAEGGPIIVELTPENSQSLSFDISVKSEGDAIRVKLEGPIFVNKDCYPQRSGTALLDGSGNELAVFIADFEASSSPPSAIGFYVNHDHSMAVFVDYLCPNEKLDQGQRFMIGSIADFLEQSSK